MRQIQLVGPVDKRPIAYSLFKLCDTMGKTLVITDDANFRRFADNYENEFTLGRSDFMIVNDISQELISSLDIKLNSYDYVIYINTNDLIDKNDCLVYCHGQSELICTEDTLDFLEGTEHFEILISAKKPSDKNKNKSAEKSALFLAVDVKNFGYVWECEENKMFMPCKSAELGKLCTHMFATPLSVPAEEITKILAKEVQ